MKSALKYLIAFVFAIYIPIITGQQFGCGKKLCIALGILSFFVVGYLFDIATRKYSEGKKPNKVILLISVAIAAALVVFKSDTLVPNVKSSERAPVTITATGEKNEASPASEVWITGITNANAPYDLKKVALQSGWEIKSENLVSQLQQPSSISFVIENSDHPTIKFLKHGWSGKVKITDGTSESVVDLYQTGQNSEFVYAISNTEKIFKKATGTKMVLYYFFAIIVFSLLLFQIITIISQGKIEVKAG